MQDWCIFTDRVIFDFEKPTLKDWKLVWGDKSFKENPKFASYNAGAPTHQGAGRFVSNHKAKGLYLSPEFTIKHPILSFMLGGKPNYKVKIELLVSICVTLACLF